MPAPAPAPSSQRIAHLVVTVALAGLGVWILWDFLPALIWATVFAIATWPLYVRFERHVAHGSGHSIAAPLIFTLLIGLLFLVPGFGETVRRALRRTRHAFRLDGEILIALCP